jgi:hypothetical protein
MNIEQLTIAEHMALAVLRGDMSAAYSLADKLVEEMNQPPFAAQVEAARILRERSTGANDGYDFYRWPEFHALCRRMGVNLQLDTIDMTITIKEGHMVVVDHTYRARDTGGAEVWPPNPPITPAEDSYDTTTMQNEVLRTRQPRQLRPDGHE